MPRTRPPLPDAADATTPRSLSPCINLCRMNPTTGWCEGCLRTIDEITAWSRLDERARQAVIAALPGRRDGLGPTVPSSPQG